MKYRLLKDCPHGVAGSVWKFIQEVAAGLAVAVVMENENGKQWAFPSSAFSDWFEKIENIPKFTKEQAEEIRKEARRPRQGEVVLIISSVWLDENTET